MSEFGNCCSCGGTEEVRNIISLNKRTPYGFGWECLQCGLPPEGAIAVLCDECAYGEAPIREVVKGSLMLGERLPYEEIASWEDFECDLSKHPEVEPYDDPIVLTDPVTGESLTESQLDEIVSRVQQKASLGMLPPYWKNEASGILQPAIVALINHGAKPDEFPPPTPQQLGLIVRYFQVYINSPCWEGEIVAELRVRAQQLQTVEDCDRWLHQAVQLGIDPL